jgi:hypothetical protein
VEISEKELYEGVSVDYVFIGDKPLFGDLFEVCGYVNPNFPPTGKFKFSDLEGLQFSQVDDYFGVRSLSDEGDDVVVWLYPIVEDEVVHHHPGPFDGMRIDYNVLRNPNHRNAHFIKICQALETKLNVSSNLSIEEMKDNNIEQGSDGAMEIDY